MEASPQRALARSSPNWPSRLQELCGELCLAAPGGRRDRIRAEVWTILVSSLTLFGRGHAKAMPSVTSEEIRDLAAKKALELLLNVESRKWNLEGRSLEEIKAYLSRVVRNGLAGQVRDQVQLRDLGQAMKADTDSLQAHRFVGDRNPKAADGQVESREFAGHLLECVRQLKPRAGKIWFLRSLLELSSKEIATRPDIAMSPGNVDVVYSRSRQVVGDCMRRKGHEPGALPSGTFSALWGEYWKCGKLVEDE